MINKIKLLLAKFWKQILIILFGGFVLASTIPIPLEVSDGSYLVIAVEKSDYSEFEKVVNQFSCNGAYEQVVNGCNNIYKKGGKEYCIYSIDTRRINAEDIKKWVVSERKKMDKISVEVDLGDDKWFIDKNYIISITEEI